MITLIDVHNNNPAANAPNHGCSQTCGICAADCPAGAISVATEDEHAGVYFIAGRMKEKTP